MNEIITFTVVVKQFNRYSRKFFIEAESETVAKEIVSKYISRLPIDQRRGTYDNYKLSLDIMKKPDFDLSVPIMSRVIDRQNTDAKDTMIAVPSEQSVQFALGVVMMSLREHLQISQRELAIVAGLRQPTVGVIERAESGLRFYNFLKIAQALGKRPDDLVRLVVEEYTRLNNEGKNDE